MLKIKSNTNEFTIIFSEKIGKKINTEKFSVPALSFFQLQRRTILFFCFSVSAPLFLVSCFSLLFFLFSTTFLVSLDVLPYFFSPKHFFSPRTFSAQNVFQPSSFYLWFSASFFSSFQPFYFS